MTHHAAIRSALPAVLACTLASCSDGPSPVGPAAPGPVLFNQGGAPSPVATGPSLDAVQSAICGFPMLVEEVGKQKVLQLPDGHTTIIHPGLKVTWTNGNTGKSLTVSESGAFQFIPLPGGGLQVVLTGATFVVFVVPGTESFVHLIHGRFTLEFGPDGSVVQGLQGHGRREDVCALLR